MFIYDEKSVFNKAKEGIPCEHGKPRYSLPEQVEYTSRQLRDTLDRLMMFEKTITDKYNDLHAIMTQDNVTFKSMMEDAWSDFVSTVKSEVNLFESNVDSLIALFKNAVNQRLEEFNENHSQAFSDYQRELSERLDSTISELNQNYDVFEELAATQRDTFNAEVTIRLNEQDAKISDAEMYMKTNLNASLENLLNGMEEDGSLVGVIDSNVMLNMKQHGAEGDGTTDITELFKAVINESHSVNNLIYIPAGTYIISETITIPDHIRVEGANENTVIKKVNSGAAFKLGAYASIGHLTVDGSNNADGIEFNGGRGYIHDVTLKNCISAIKANEIHSNLSRVYRASILDCNTGIFLPNNNGSNSQSMTFCDIDIRGCMYGVQSSQPASKYINLCVQNGISGGCAIWLMDEANNNVFIGTYLENADYTCEVNFTSTKYNHFIGGRPIQYGNSFINNDGTNVVMTRSNQYNNAMFERGNIGHQSINVIAKEAEQGMPSAVMTVKHNGDNEVLVDTLGTSVPTEMDFANVRVREDNLVHCIGSRKYKGMGMISYTPSYPSFTAGETVTGFTSVIGDADLVMIQASNPGVRAWIERATNGQHKITAKNETTNNLSGVTINFTILYATNC